MSSAESIRTKKFDEKMHLVDELIFVEFLPTGLLLNAPVETSTVCGIL